MREFATLSLVVMLASQVMFLLNFFWCMFKAGKAGGQEPVEGEHARVDDASRLRRHGNWPRELPTCYRGPYEFSVPGRKETSGRRTSLN